MTNGEKYKTAKERTEAFEKWCKKRKCSECDLVDYCPVRFLSEESARATHYPDKGTILLWLDIEDTTKKLSLCPFCGNEVKIGEIDNDKTEAVEFYIHCDGCHITTADFATREELLSMWNNRVANMTKEANND